MKRLSADKRAQALDMLSEGVSVSATVRLTGISKPTVLKLLIDAGHVAAAYQGERMRDLPSRRIQVDEIWAFVGKKAKNVTEEERGMFGVGDVYTFTAIDPDTKLVPTWYVGQRDIQSARRFLLDLVRRMRNRIQLTTDGANFYREAVLEAFGGWVDYAQLIKIYAMPQDAEKRYSPSQCVGTETRVLEGNPDPEFISTSLVERQNLTMRMNMRRFTRLTNGFSKKVLNHSSNVALHFFAYNFIRPHGTLTCKANGKPTTPAMAAGLADAPMTMRDLVGILEETEPDAREVGKRRRDRREE